MHGPSVLNLSLRNSEADPAPKYPLAADGHDVSQISHGEA